MAMLSWMALGMGLPTIPAYLAPLVLLPAMLPEGSTGAAVFSGVTAGLGVMGLALDLHRPRRRGPADPGEAGSGGRGPVAARTRPGYRPVGGSPLGPGLPGSEAAVEHGPFPRAGSNRPGSFLRAGEE